MRGAVSEGTETETSKGAQLLSTPVGVRTRAWKVKTKTWNFKNSSVVYQEYLQKYLTFYAEPATTWKEEILPNVCRLQIFILICKPKSNFWVSNELWNEIVNASRQSSNIEVILSSWRIVVK